MVFATAGSTACVHLVAGGATSLPAPSTILSIAIGVQVSPLLAMPAKAVAIVRGAMLFVPRIDAGLESSGVPTAVWTPKASASFLISHRSSWYAIATKAVLMELVVAF